MKRLKIPESFTDMLRSRRFIAAGASILVMSLVVAVPELEPLEDGLVSLMVNVIVALLDAPVVV
jgi:hypothetical protein